jgi:hypothetical protein
MAKIFLKENGGLVQDIFMLSITTYISRLVSISKEKKLSGAGSPPAMGVLNGIDKNRFVKNNLI